MTNTRIFSGIQPSGNSGVPHLGNYLGALKNWVSLQHKHDCIFCIVDLHALTTLQNPTQLQENIISMTKSYLSCGIDHRKSIIFQQSHVPYHTNLGWILTTMTKMGWLNRMTQFKSKAGISVSDKISRLKSVLDEMTNVSETEAHDIFEKYENTQSEGISAGLYMYPVLMAADILLYKTTHVPVGSDQLQHLQLARMLARTFNSQYGDIFPVPEEIINTGSRIMSLRYPDRKMSKSTMETEEEIIFLTDTKDQIAKKIKRATTDSDLLPYEIGGLTNRLGASNLLTIYSCINDITLDEACQRFGGKGFGYLKKELSDSLIDTIIPIGERIKSYDDATIKNILVNGNIQAGAIAMETMFEVFGIMGM